MDGTGVPMRASELAGRAGKQPDGSAKTREVKLCTVWSAEERDEEGTPVRDPGSISYSAAIESAAQKDTDEVPSEFAARVERETTRRGFDRAARRVVLGDGAKWIWSLATEHYPDAVQIVDRFHAKQHLSDVGKSIYGVGSDLSRAVGARAPRRVGCGRHRCRPDRLTSTLAERRGGAQVRRVRRGPSRPHALRGVPGGRAVHLDRGRRGRLQDGDRDQVQAGRDALDSGRG
jgi:hypothetical protein